MSDYWLSTRSPAAMFRPTWQTEQLGKFLRDHRGVDVAMLSVELGICVQHLKSYQRKLGLRKLTGNKPRKSKQ